MFHELSQSLPEWLPLIGMQPRGLEGDLVPYLDVPTAARAYVRSLREVQPVGPYRLVGHSFGGWVAFEMALLLAAQGEAISDLFIVDSNALDDAATTAKTTGRVPALLKLIDLYISATEGLHDLQERLDSWRMFAPHLNDARMPGNHMTMLSAPHAETLGTWLGERLEVAGAGLNLLPSCVLDRVPGQ